MDDQERFQLLHLLTGVFQDLNTARWSELAAGDLTQGGYRIDWRQTRRQAVSVQLVQRFQLAQYLNVDECIQGVKKPGVFALERVPGIVGLTHLMISAANQ